MTVVHWLQQSTGLLERAGIGTARLDCLVLLEDVLNTNRTHILAHPEHEITDEELAILSIVLEKRAQYIPLAYIRQKTEFYGREFYVDERVLEPRPESEAMIELLKKLDLPHGTELADVGTGSGALGITAGFEVPGLRIDLLDIDTGALAVAARNVELHNSPARCAQTDLLDGSAEHYDVLLCNLPYVPDNFQINRAATHEPDIALFGGADGLDLYRKLYEQISGRSSRPAHILTECLPPQHPMLTEIAEAHGYDLAGTNDFIQHFTRQV